MKKNIWLVVILLLVLTTDIFSCTIIMVRGKGVAIAGSNEDFITPLTMMWYTPASENYYARVCFGFNMLLNSTQGGMNEHGLFVDGNALGKQGWKSDEGRKNFRGSILDHLLACCANVEEVKDFFRNYNCPALDVARIPVMDKSGASMIVEWHNGKVVFLETEKEYQISTNFIGSDFIGKEKPCWRYNTADRLLGQQSQYSFSVVRNALDETHVDGAGSKTLYSFICDLRTGDIYVYNYHDFSNPRIFNFNEEIQKGQHSHYMAELFPGWSLEYEKFIQEGPFDMLQRGLRSGRMQANMFYQILKTNYPKVFNRDIGPDLLNMVSSGLISEGRVDDAIFFLERNARDFPDIPSTHFELGKLYQHLDNKGKALEEYRLTLQIDPDHEGARIALEEIEKLHPG